MEQIEARILDRVYKLQVPGEERHRLLRAVELVDRKMREIRDTGKAQGPDRIAVNAALQLVYEFLGREAAASTAVSVAPADDAPSPLHVDVAGPALASGEVVDPSTADAKVPDPAVAHPELSDPAAVATKSASARPADGMRGGAGPAGDAGVAGRRAASSDARRATGVSRPARVDADKGADRAPTRAVERGSERSERASGKGSGNASQKSATDHADPGHGNSKDADRASTAEPSDAEIDRISAQLEAEIRRQESLF